MRILLTLAAIFCLLTGCSPEKAPQETVWLAENRSGIGESYYTVAAQLPRYTAEQASSDLAEKLMDNWRVWDSMDEMAQLLSSRLPGHCDSAWDTWAECEKYLAVRLENPLEEDLAYANESAIPLDTPALKGNGHHAKVSFSGQRDGTLDEVSIRAGYLDEEVRLALTVHLRCGTEEPFTTASYWAEAVDFETETVTLGDGTQVLLMQEESPGEYSALDAYFVKSDALYTLRAIGGKGEDEAVRQTMNRALESFGTE